MLWHTPTVVLLIEKGHNMNISPIALKIWAVHNTTSRITTRKSFHDNWKTEDEFLAMMSDIPNIDDVVHDLSVAVDDMDWMDGAVCCFDADFPVINESAPKGDRPYLLFYKGDLSLLSDLNRNVAVIGYTTPNEDIMARESKIVEQLVQRGQHIVSGLAKGCDAIGHTVCMDYGGKTIAILPLPLNAISPADHRDMAHQIIEKGGLVISEYYNGPRSRHEAINRYVERDRLQALFAKAVVLIASYEGRDGDSGSRHAMGKAHSYGHLACAMYDETTDSEVLEMKLNRSLLSQQKAKQLVTIPSEVGAAGYTSVTVDDLVSLVNPALEAQQKLF